MNNSDIIIYILYHNDESFIIASKFLKYNWAKLIKINSTKYFESIIFEKLDNIRDEWENKKFVGFLTYSSYYKIKIFNFENIALKYSDYDVIALNSYFNNSLIVQAELNHPNFINIWKYILLKLNYKLSDILSINIPVFYNNYWMAKPEWIKKYIIFFKKVINLMENDDILKNKLYDNSNYVGNLLNYPHKLLKICDRPYYTFHPFILERLVCFFFWIENAKIFQGQYNNNKNINFIISNFENFLFNFL